MKKVRKKRKKTPKRMKKKYLRRSKLLAVVLLLGDLRVLHLVFQPGCVHEQLRPQGGTSLYQQILVRKPYPKW